MRESDYHPMRFRLAFPEDPTDPTDFFVRERARARRTAFLKWTVSTVGAIGTLVLMAGVYNHLKAESSAAGGSRWGEKWNNEVIVKELATDGNGNLVIVRSLEDDLPGDLVGFTRSGCLVRAKQVRGPDYPVNTQDEGNLTLVTETNTQTGETERFRPWFQVEVPAYGRDENGRFSPKIDKNGNTIILRGFISGADLTSPRYGQTCR